MFRFLRGLLLSLVAIAAILGALVYLLGPHADVSMAFDRYRAGYAAGDARVVADMTAESEISYWATIRKHAQASAREVVEGLPFRDRYNIFSLRQRVRQGEVDGATLSATDPKIGYKVALDFSLPTVKRYKDMGVLFAVPVGFNTVRGYMSLVRDPATNVQDLSLQSAAMALTFGVYFNFEKSQDSWRVDPTPIMLGSASENEYWARQMEPTGNQFIFTMLGAKDGASQGLLWTPLQQNTQ